VQKTASQRFLASQCEAGTVNHGAVQCSSLALNELEKLRYGSYWIYGSDDENFLVPGDVFAVHTNSGSYAKVRVKEEFDLRHNHGLVVEWVVYPAK
jgi:hypothetical protein